MNMLPDPPDVVCVECTHCTSPLAAEYSFCDKNILGYSPVTGKLVYEYYPIGEPFRKNGDGKCSSFEKLEEKDK